ncbi:hypothetical protein [Arthrobacter sp. Y-9]|uniref:hypothetical protein n=1 Tax=Arthrobacter sp. Y-9 TaxID=3039385 RepID=UPI00241C8C90|nr:hypothetical protein [Arthrobacter sp. Y-9]WFR84408.1 hypothetical protein P9849_01785 [Arthrobacter sp. Y-9]
MTHPAPPARQRSRTATIALGLSITMLVAAAVLGGIFIILGDQANVAGRAWLTLLLVGLFAGAVVLDGSMPEGRNRWYLAVSTILNVVLLAIGLLKIWNGWLQPADTASAAVWTGQIARFVSMILLVRVALLLTQLYVPRFITGASKTGVRISSMATLVFAWLTVVELVLPAAFPAMDWPSWWWRTAGATSLIAIVGLVIPLVLRAFEPKPPAVQLPPQEYAQQQWTQAPQWNGYAQQPQQGQPAAYPQQWQQEYPQPGYPQNAYPQAGHPQQGYPQDPYSQQAQQQAYPQAGQYGQQQYGQPDSQQQGQEWTQQAGQGWQQPSEAQQAAPEASRPSAPSEQTGQAPQPDQGQQPGQAQPAAAPQQAPEATQRPEQQ